METFAPVAPAFACPGRDLLIDFDLGKLPESDLDAVAEHISSCSQCEAILSDLQNEPSPQPSRMGERSVPKGAKRLSRTEFVAEVKKKPDDPAGRRV